MLRILLGALYTALVLALFLPALIAMLPSRKTRIHLGNYAGHLIGRGLMWLSGSSFDQNAVIPRLNSLSPAIYISNHTSILDIFLGVWLAPVGVCGVGKKEVIYYPFFGQLFFLSGHLRVNRANRDQAVAALSGMAKLMKKHNLGLWVWPEGTRSRDGRLKVFKKGFAHMAIATRLPIVPVVVAGMQKAWQHGKWEIVPTKLQITVLDPIPTDDWSLENLDEKIEMVRQKFNTTLPEEQRLLPEVPGAGPAT